MGRSMTRTHATSYAACSGRLKLLKIDTRLAMARLGPRWSRRHPPIASWPPFPLLALSLMIICRVFNSPRMLWIICETCYGQPSRLSEPFAKLPSQECANPRSGAFADHPMSTKRSSKVVYYRPMITTTYVQFVGQKGSRKGSLVIILTPRPVIAAYLGLRVCAYSCLLCSASIYLPSI